MNRSIENSPPHGLEEVYAEYRTYFVRIAVSYVRDRMVAEDLVSDTFLKIWESRTETTPRNLPAYLLTALKRKCLDYLRDQAIHLRIQQNMHQTSARVVGERIARLEANDPQNLMMSEALAIIERELRRMPEQRRRIFIAHRYEEMSYREIAAVYELSEGQVTYELRAAKEALKAALKDYLPLIGLLLNGFCPPPPPGIIKNIYLRDFAIFFANPALSCVNIATYGKGNIISLRGVPSIA